MILDVLKGQLPFIIALVIGTIAHTICGGIKHIETKDFDWKALWLGAIKFACILLCIEFVMVGINIYSPLYEKFNTEIQALEEVIVIGVFAKVIVLIKDYFEISEEETNEHEVE